MHVEASRLGIQDGADAGQTVPHVHVRPTKASKMLARGAHLAHAEAIGAVKKPLERSSGA